MRKDAVVEEAGISPREMRVHMRYSLTGRTSYPFKHMWVGDWFELPTGLSALAVRAALQSHRRRRPEVVFAVRQRLGVPGKWVCRRML